jgi:hypothetical protein
VLDNLRTGATLDEVADWFEIDRAKLEEVLSFLASETKDPIQTRDHVFAG